MNILKTSALAAVLALGSLSANASYSGSDLFNIIINTSAPISVQFDAADTITFASVIPGDTLDGQIGVTIQGDSANAMACTINGASMSDGVATTLDIKDPGPDTVAGNGDDRLLVAALGFTLASCADDANGTTLEVDGIVHANAPVGVTHSTDFTLSVSYGTNSTITGVNS